MPHSTKLFLLLALLCPFLLSTTPMDTPVTAGPKQPLLLYVYDPLCGWCYGFAPVMDKIHTKYKDRLRFKVVSGGMIVGDRIGPIGVVAPYIKHAYKDVERATGVKFGEGFLKGILDDGKAVFTSIPPSQALAVFKKMKPGHAMQFAHELQTAIYYDGIRPAEYSDYKKLAERHGLNGEEFVRQMQTPEAKAAAEQDFALSDSLGVQGFPTVFLVKDDKAYRLTSGYVGEKDMEKTLERALQ